eukprot:s2045_g14.t1
MNCDFLNNTARVRRPTMGQIFGDLGNDVGELLSIHSESEDFEHIPEDAHAMTDASKRRLSPEPVRRNVSAAGSQLRLAPTAKALACPADKPVIHLDPADIPFPADVENMSDWGTTVLRVGKFEKAGLSYAELRGSEDVETKKYLTWLMKSIRPSFAPQYHDLVAYLKKAEYGTNHGNTFVRVRK